MFVFQSKSWSSPFIFAVELLAFFPLFFVVWSLIVGFAVQSLHHLGPFGSSSLPSRGISSSTSRLGSELGAVGKDRYRRDQKKSGTQSGSASLTHSARDSVLEPYRRSERGSTASLGRLSRESGIERYRARYGSRSPSLGPPAGLFASNRFVSAAWKYIGVFTFLYFSSLTSICMPLFWSIQCVRVDATNKDHLFAGLDTVSHT